MKRLVRRKKHIQLSTYWMSKNSFEGVKLIFWEVIFVTGKFTTKSSVKSRILKKGLSEKV